MIFGNLVDSVHRDLKYENVLFVNETPQAEIKLIDFGLSQKFFGNEELTEGVGTM
jgi:calcium-dependent protein kinase